MTHNEDYIHKDEVIEGLHYSDSCCSWHPSDYHIYSYVASPIQLHFVSSKTVVIGRALRYAIVDLVDHVTNKSNEYIENETTVIGTEHRLHHSRHYTFKLNDDELQFPHFNHSDQIELEISSLAPTIFYQLREDIGISTNDFRQSFLEHHLKDFTNPGKSGSLMYKSYDDLFILKTLRAYEARLLLQILSGYRLQLTQRPTILNRYVGLYVIRFPTLTSSIETYIVIMANAFTPSLQVNEIFDLKGSTIQRKLVDKLSVDKLCRLKDLDFIDLYPHGIRIPSSIYHRLETVISNDVKVLRKLNITDYSLILGIKHIDTSIDELMQRRPTTGVAALFHMSNSLAYINVGDRNLLVSPSSYDVDLKSLPISYLKPLKMIGEKIDTLLYYHDDLIAYAALPIPGIINKTNQRVYLYLAIIDMLQTFDSIKFIEQTVKKITDYTHHHQYSVVGSDEYEKRIKKFLFDTVFVDAGDDFPWIVTDINKAVSNTDNVSVTNNASTTEETHTHTQTKTENLNNVIKFRL